MAGLQLHRYHYQHYHTTVSNPDSEDSKIIKIHLTLPPSTMAVQSTMQPLPIEVFSLQQTTKAEEGLRSPPATLVMSMPSAVCLSSSTLPLADPLASGLYGDYHHGSAPCDGTTVWYCCQCGDGGIGVWQSSCPSCYIARCGCCKVEEV
ncbi:hypothetical protein M3J09_001038 [Ascochyta lentis]